VSTPTQRQRNRLEETTHWVKLIQLYHSNTHGGAQDSSTADRGAQLKACQLSFSLAVRVLRPFAPDSSCRSCRLSRANLTDQVARSTGRQITGLERLIKGCLFVRVRWFHCRRLAQRDNLRGSNERLFCFSIVRGVHLYLLKPIMLACSRKACLQSKRSYFLMRPSWRLVILQPRASLQFFLG
jgi:hypothetical protein